jgi:hypothetical protein
MLLTPRTAWSIYGSPTDAYVCMDTDPDIITSTDMHEDSITVPFLLDAARSPDNSTVESSTPPIMQQHKAPASHYP